MATRKVLVDLDFNAAGRVTNLLDPSSAQDAATKAYVDANIEGLAWKDSCRAASTANVNLASPGATLDGVTLTSGDRILVKNQSTGAENGIYIWNGAATPATRSLDASTAAELEAACVVIEEGTTNSGTTWRQTAVNFTLGSGSVSWTTFGTAAGAASESTAGIAEIATQAETDTGTDDARFVTPLKLATYTNRAKRYATTIGDGSSTSIVVTHNLGTADVVVQVRETGGNKTVVECEVRETSSNSITLLFNVAPASSALRVVVVA